MGKRRWRLRTQQSNSKGKWTWTNTSLYVSKADAVRASKKLRAGLRRDKEKLKARGKKFFYRVSVLKPKRRKK